MNIYLLKEKLTIEEVASLAETGRVLTGDDYKKNNEIKEWKNLIQEAIKNNEIAFETKKNFSGGFFFLEDGGRTTEPQCFYADIETMETTDVFELFQKKDWPDKCFNIKTTQPETAALPKIPWIAPDNRFAALIAALYKNGYIQANSIPDALRKCAPYFTVSNNIDSLRKGLERFLEYSNDPFESMQTFKSEDE